MDFDQTTFALPSLQLDPVIEDDNRERGLVHGNQFPSSPLTEVSEMEDVDTPSEVLAKSFLDKVSVHVVDDATVEGRDKTQVDPQLPLTISHDPDGVAVVEELDSPATRRAKHFRRKTSLGRLSKMRGAPASSVERQSELGANSSDHAAPRPASLEPVLTILQRNGKNVLEGGTLGERDSK